MPLPVIGQQKAGQVGMTVETNADEMANRAFRHAGCDVEIEPPESQIAHALSVLVEVLDGLREHLRFTVNRETIDIFRRNNKGPMILWPYVSTAPHCYLMSICGMFDRLDLYLWFRVVVANAIFIIALIWQRTASARTLREFDAIDAAPVPIKP